MTNIVNPRKLFRYKVTINSPDIPSFYIQDFKNPDVQITPDKHGVAGNIIKTAGIREEGNASLERLLPATKGNGGFSSVSGGIWAWAALANDGWGNGSDPDVYKREVIVEELANDGYTSLDTWTLLGCWPTSINGREFKAADSGNRVENVELSVDRVLMNGQIVNPTPIDVGI
jgi:hypothetical protein